ncbi:hypothetical protein [Mycobacterium kyorinense]|uniref:hypothetical protein n=1 Tax=Mycobacterium kyorinense TaxID=487514 RepID=UPI000704AA79|nr:hypothetical protein [Mycobacterium kyorinense]
MGLQRADLLLVFGVRGVGGLTRPHLVLEEPGPCLLEYPQLLVDGLPVGVERVGGIQQGGFVGLGPGLRRGHFRAVRATGPVDAH